MMKQRQFSQLAASASAFLLFAHLASAQSYPSRPITVIVPTGAGGPQDVIARIITDHMRSTLGQPLIIENVPGANGSLGIGRLARAKPDGYTLGFSVSSATHVFNAAMYALPYDVVNDFAPIAMVTRDTGQVIVAKNTMPADNLSQLLAWLRANPGKASLGHTGIGSPAHVSSILFQKQFGITLQDVAYRNAGQAMQDLIGGHIDMMFTSPSIALSPIHSGNIRAYAVLAKERLQAAPDIPTGDEAGLPGFYTAGWHAFWAPMNTPREIILKQNVAIVDALADGKC